MFRHWSIAGANLGGGVTRVTSHPPARQPISCYYYACDFNYFDVVLCHSSSQILATPLHQEVTFSYYTDLTIAIDRYEQSKARVPNVTPPPLKNHRSANESQQWSAI